MIERFHCDCYYDVGMVRADSGDYVTYEDHAAEVARLNEQVLTLAAENHYLLGRIDWPKEQCPVSGAVTDVQPEDFIPATDSILNEVRAQAVGAAFEAVIDACRTDDEIDERLWNHGVLQVQTHMEKYAARIRSGEVQL